jgi:two-component sensor histidine kinase
MPVTIIDSEIRRILSVVTPFRDLETARFSEVLASYKTIDLPQEGVFDNTLNLALMLFDTPVAIISMVGSRRQWFRTRDGSNMSVLPADHVFSDHVIASDGMVIVSDASSDPRFAASALIAGAPWMRFCAGAALVGPAGTRLGSLCVMSPEARPGLDEREQRMLGTLAGIASSKLELWLRTTMARRFAQREVLLAEETDRWVVGTLRLVAHALEDRAKCCGDRATRRALYEAVDRLAAVEQLHQQLGHGHAGFATDARAYLQALIGNLEDAAADDTTGRAISISLGAGLTLPTGCLLLVGIVATELVCNALRHGNGAVAVNIGREGNDIVVCVEHEAPMLEGPTFDAPLRDDSALAIAAHNPVGLEIVALLAAPGGVSVDPANDRRIVVRVAAELAAAA